MAAAGLLVVSNIKHIGRTLRAVKRYVSALYIHLNIPECKVQPLPTWGRLISQLYVDHASVDMRILVGTLKDIKLSSSVSSMQPVTMIFSDMHAPGICESLRSHLNIPSETIYLPAEEDGIESTNDVEEFQSYSQPYDVYDTVVLGGTFDRIHLGHKIFLTQAVLRACRRLVVGVTTSKLTKSKTLAELVLPVERRIQEVREFLMEIDDTLQYDVVPIDDPFGPTQSDPNMDLIVVSAETLRGGEKVNEIRMQKNLRPLKIFCIDLVKSNCEGGPKEPKISSSNTRVDLLGTRIRQPEPRPHLPDKPYIIGLTGGIAAGKSKMAERFAKMGAAILYCDAIAHEIYEPGLDCFKKVVLHFGEDILDPNGHINRRKLGDIVFSHPQQLDALNHIVWPELMLEVKRRIRKLCEEEHPRVVIIEAAVLLMAGWETECHEVWSLIVPREMAVRRVMQRNGLSEEEAHQRQDSQWQNSEIVAKSNVVFSSQWDDEFTQQQAEKAWKMLMHDLDRRQCSGSIQSAL